MKCVNIATKEFKELAKSNNVDLGTLEMIVHKYWAETKDDTVFPTSVYIQAQLGNVKYIESGENVRELWEIQYKEPKQFSTLEKVQQAANEALKFFPEDAVTYHKTADGKYILSVKQPVKSLGTSTKEALKDSSLKNTEHFGEVSSTATRELLENIANSNRRQFLFMEEEEVKSKIADFLQKSRIPRRTVKRLTDNIEKMSKKDILEELGILEREQRDFELIARNLGIKEKKGTSNTEEETQFAVETKHSFTFNDGTTISTPFELNSEQRDALNAMDLFIHSRRPEDFSMTLSGYAGTGKTSIMEMLAEKARMDGIPIKFTASTNKASQVLRDRVMKRGFIAQTLHRLFNYRQQQDETKAYDAKETITVPGGRPKYFWGDIVVIDEASMIDDVLYQNLIEDAKNNNLKIIFVGDRAQLAPVNQATISKVFIDPDPNRKVVELFKVERTGDNAILEEATGLRNNQALTKKSKFNSKGQGVAYISSKNRTAIIDTIQHFLPHIKDNPDYFRILAWSNAAVSEHNETVRRLLGYSGKMPQVGEPMVGYTNWGWHEASDYESPYDLVNSEPYKVVNVGQPRTITKSFQRVSDGVMTTVQLQAIPLTLEDSVGERKQFNFIDVKSNAQNWAAAKQLALQKDALWKKYKTAPKGRKNVVGTKSWYRDQANQIEQFLFINDSIEIPDSNSRRGKRTLQSKVIDFGYAMTVHKSQGSTFTHVIMDDVNISQAKQEEDDSPATGNVSSVDAQLANAEFEAVGPKKKTSFNFRAMAGLDPNTPETLIKEAPKVSPTRQAELANIRQQLKYVAMTRATDTVTVISESPTSEDSVLNHLSNTQNTAPTTGRTPSSPSSSTNAMKMSSAQIWNYMSEVTSNIPSQTVPYTQKGKERQVYTVHDGHIFNKDGIEVFAGDSVDRNKILANLALKEGRAVEVTHKDHRYVVDGNKNITSVTTGKVMAWGYENGDRKAILSLAEQQFRSIIYNTQRSVSSQLVTQLKKLGFEVYGKEALEQYLKEHPNAMNQQALEEQKEMAEIKAKAIADGTFMKAPNGKPTNLNERQWLQTRTKPFRRWFGDWLTYQRIQNAKVIWGHPGTGKTWLFKQGRKDIIDFDSEYKAKLGDFREREVLKKEIGKEAYNQKLDELFEEARQEAIKSGRKLLVSDLHFLRDRADDLDLITNISNEEFIERSHQRGEHDEADKMEWKNSINAAMQNISSDKVIDTSGYISDLMDGTNVSKVVDENGEPKVMYHYTDEKFTEFSLDFFGAHDPGDHGRGFYFTSFSPQEDGYFKDVYGDIVMPVFLNIKNPVPYEDSDALDINGRRMGKHSVVNDEDFNRVFPNITLREHLEKHLEGLKWDLEDIEYKLSGKAEGIDINDDFYNTLFTQRRDWRIKQIKEIEDKLKSTPKDELDKSIYADRNTLDEYDGVFNGDFEVVVKSPNQIKSATDNIGTFSTENDDIQMAVEDPIGNPLIRKKYSIETKLRKIIDEINSIWKQQSGKATSTGKIQTEEGSIEVSWADREGRGKTIEFDSGESIFSMVSLSAIVDTANNVLDGSILFPVWDIMTGDYNYNRKDNPIRSNHAALLRGILQHYIANNHNKPTSKWHVSSLRREHNLDAKIGALSNAIGIDVSPYFRTEQTYIKENGKTTEWERVIIDAKGLLKALPIIESSLSMSSLEEALQQVEESRTSNTLVRKNLSKRLKELNEEREGLENDLEKIKKQIREEESSDLPFFTTPAGEVYGFVTKDGKIYLDETVISPEHPIHEYTHIWDRIVAQKNPKLWKRGVELMKELDLWKKIEENEHYGKKWIERGIAGERLENLIASEVHARLVGQEGEAILNKVAQKKGHEGIVDKLKSWMLDVWKALKGTFSNWSDSEIAKLTLDDFKQMTIRDFADAVDLVNAPDVTTSSPENTTKAIEKSTNRVRDYYRWQRKHITFDKDSHTYFYDGMPIDYSVTEYKDYLYGKPNILGDYSHSREMGNSVDALTRDFFSKDKDPRNLSYPNLNEERKNQIIRDLERLKKFFDKKFSGNYKVITTEFPIAGKIKTPDGEKTVAGTIDMLIIDGEGNLHILDMKVKKNSIDAYNDRRDYTFQLNAYRQLLETIFPEFSGKIKDLNLIWFDTAYPRQGKEATFVTHDSGMVTVSDDKVTDLPLSEYDSWKTPSLKSNVEESLVPLERKNVLENVKSLKEDWGKENVEQLPSPQPGKALGEDAEIYSGAAEGSDTMWANKAKELDINVKEYTVKDWDKLPQTWKDKLDAEYIEVVRALKRLPYKRDSYKGKLVRRDMMQADKADAIFAIGHVVKPGEMGKQYTNNSNHDIVDGGTGYAVQRGIIRGIPVYVFDQADGRWKVWDKESNSFITTSEPALTPHAATIGTREIEENGKQAIESVLNKIPRTVVNVQQQGQQPTSQVQQSIIQQHQGIWTRESVEKDPETLYIFTDNTDRDSGSGEVPADSWYAQKYGQGHHYPNATTARIRGLNNARPISTVKWFYRNHQGVPHPKYNRNSEALWHDKDFEEFKKVVDAEFADILAEWKTGKYKRIMFPQGDGLFNGEISAITKERTPKIYEYLQKKYQELQQQIQQVVPQPSEGLLIVPTSDTNRKAQEVGGIDTLRHPDANGMHFGNPFSHTNYSGVKKVVGSVKEASEAYEQWLRGEKYQEIEPERRKWILDQINSGKLDGKPLVYYTEKVPDNSYGRSTYDYNEAPNHAHKLQKLILEHQQGNVIGQQPSSPANQETTVQETPAPSSDTEMDIWWGSGEKDPNRQNAELSNFAKREFDFETSLDDIPHFTSVEQAFQYHKLIEMYDEMDEDTFNEWEDKILNADGAEARRLGRRIPMSMGARARWDEKSSEIMKELLKASFEQNEEARKKLFETGNATLTHNFGTGKWKTEFPRLLMEVRDELREEYAEQAPYEVSTSSEVDESQAETPQETETTQNVETRIPVSLPNFANVTGIQDDMVVDAQWKVAEMVTLDNEINDENTDGENQELVNRILAVAKAKDKASYKRSITTQKKLGEHNRLNKGIDNLMKSRLLSSSEVRHAAEQVANYISDTITEIQKGDKTVQEVFPRLNSAFNGKGASRKDIVQNIGIDNFIQLAKDNIDPSVNMNITSRSLARQAQLLIDNWEALMTFATDTFVMNEGFGIRKDYTRRGFSVTESQHLTMEDLNQHNDVDSVREKEGDEQEHWQVEFRTVDAINSMSELVRIAFHECYLIDPNKEGEDKRVMSKWNIPERVDMKEAVQSVLKWTQGALTLDEMVNKMRKHINEAPWLEQMIKRLSDESGAETDFQSQFFGVMNRHFQLYSIVRNKNGKFVSQIINEKPALLKLTRTVESKYKMGEHPLLSSTGINASSLEALRKTLSELETLKAALEEYEKQHLDEKAELSNEDRATAFRNLSAMSKLLGFDIPNEIWDRVINVDNIKEMTKYLRYIVNSLDKVISSKQENYDPFKFKGLNSIGGTLQNLMTPVADIMENTGVSSFFDDGKMYQSYVTPSWMTKLMKKFKGNDKDVVDFIMREYGNSEWFKEQIDSYEGWKSGWRNKWLERLINDPAAREIFAHKVELNFNKHNYMRTMTDTEYALSLVAEFFAEASKDKDGRMPAWFRIPMLSNKPSSEFIRQYAYTGMEYKEAITEDLFGIYLQELMRIQTVIRRNKKEGDPGFIKNFDTNGRKFCFLPFLNKEMENNTRLGYLLNEKIKSESEFEHEAELEKLVTKAIKDHMDERVKKIMAEWKQKGILKAAEKIDGIGRGEQKIAENIEKFLWNDHLASMNILQLTIGDIAFYKDAEDLQKRLAQIHAPGTRANIRARDYETGEFVSDGTYRTIILKDFDGFKSNIIANITEVFDRKIARAKNDAERKSLEVLKDYLVRPRTYKEDGTIDDEGGEYWKINVADAQGYSSPSSYRKKALMFGRWSREAEKIFKRLQHNDYDMTQLKTVFQPLKPFVYSRIEKTIAGKESPIQKIYAPFQAKNAEYLLVMAGAIIEGEEAESGRLGRPNLLKAIHRIMEESESLKPGKGIDTVQFESAIKSSLQTPIDIQQFAEDPNGEERAYQHMKNLIFMNEKDGEGNRIYANYNNSEYVHEASYEDYCLQQEVPEHFKDHDQAHGSQIRMIMPADLDLYYDYNKKEGREDESNKVYYEWTEPGGKKMKVSATEYKKLYEETISANIEDSLDELAKELHLDTKDIKERNAILSDFLQREIVDSPRYGIDLFQACSLNENGEFRIPKGDPIQAKRIEQLINSLIKNRVNKQTIPGGPVVQVTNFGTSRQLHIRFKDKSKEGALIPLEEEYNPAEHGGKSYKDYCKDNQGGIAYFEVFAPIPSEDWIEKFGNPDGTIDIAAIEKIDPKLLEMVSYRIPTEDKYSCAPMKIVGFLPRQAGEAIMLPYELTTIDGSDFDVDKRYIMRRDIDIVVDKDKVRKHLFNKTTLGWEKSGRKLDFAAKNKLRDEINIFLDNPEKMKDFDAFNSALYAEYKKYIKEGRPYKASYPKEARRVRNNRIIDMSWAVLTHEMTADKILNPGNFEQQKEVGYRISAFKNPANRTKNWEDLVGKDSKTLKKLSYVEKDLTWVDTQLQFYHQNNAGSSLIGVFAVNKVAHATLGEDKIFADIKEICGDNPLKIAGFEFKSRMEVDPMYDKKGNLIGKTLGSLVAASADTAKDPVLDLMNINMSTAGMLTSLLRLGMPFEDAAIFLSQDIITEVLEEMNIRRLQGQDSSLESIVHSKKKEIVDEIKEFDPEFKIGPDDNIHKEEITRQELINGLRKGSSLATQYKVLEALVRVKALADSMRNLTFATRFNSISSAVGPLIIDNIILEHKMDNLRLGPGKSSTGFYYEGGLTVTIDNIFEKHPILGSFGKTVGLAKNLFMDMPAGSTGFRNLLNTLQFRFGDKFAEKFYKDRKLMDAFSMFYQSYILVQEGLINPRDCEYYVNQFPHVFYSKDYKSKYPDNALIQAIDLTLSERTGRAFLNISISGMSTTEKERLSSAWYDLQKVDPQLSKDLFNYCFFRAGIGFSPKSFMSLLNTYVKEELQSSKEYAEPISYVDIFRKLPSIKDPEFLIELFVRNNWNYPRLVKTAGGENTNYKYYDDHLIVDSDSDMMALKGAPFIKIKNDGEDTYTLWQLLGKEKDNKERRYYVKIAALGENGEFLQILPTNGENGKPIVESQSDIINSLPMEDPNNSDLAFFMESDPETFEDMEDDVEIEPTITEEAKEIAEEAEVLLRDAFGIKESTRNSKKDNSKLTVSRFKEFVDDAFERLGITIDEEKAKEETDKYC